MHIYLILNREIHLLTKMQMCCCFRPIESHKEICFECLNLLDIIDNDISGVIPASVNKIITPIKCKKCSELLADIFRYREHFNQKHIHFNFKHY